MFKLIYVKSVLNLNNKSLLKIKKKIEKLENFPNISQIKHLKTHPLADYRLRIGYRVLFNVDWYLYIENRT